MIGYSKSIINDSFPIKTGLKCKIVNRNQQVITICLVIHVALMSRFLDDLGRIIDYRQGTTIWLNYSWFGEGLGFRGVFCPPGGVCYLINTPCKRVDKWQTMIIQQWMYQ